MFRLAVIYDSGKRYIIPFEVLDDLLDEETIAKIKKTALKEINKQ